MDQSLLDYVKQAKAAGSDRPSVQQALIGAGWNATDVGQVLDMIFGAAAIMAAPAVPPQPVAAEPVVSPSSAPTVNLKNWKDAYEFPARRKGWLLILLPNILLIGVLIVMAISASMTLSKLSFGATSALAATVDAPGASPAGYPNDPLTRQRELDDFGTYPGLQKGSGQGSAILRGLMNLVGMLAVLLMFISFPLGLVLLGKRRVRPGIAYDTRSGAGSASIVPPEIQGWSWAGAGLGMTWGLYHHAWLSLLEVVPPLNIVWWIVMGLKGKEWAWQSMPWLSVEHFNHVQRTWNRWGGFFFILKVILPLIGLAVGMAVPMLLLGLKR